MSLIPRLTDPKYLKQFKTFLFDCDGVLWRGKNVFPGATETIQKLLHLDKNVIFVTNNSTKSRAQYVPHFDSLGFQNLNEHNVMCTSHAVGRYLKTHLPSGSSVYLVGNDNMAHDIRDEGFTVLGHEDDGKDIELHRLRYDYEMDASVKCVVAGFDAHISYQKCFIALNYLKNPDCLFVATNTDTHMPVENGMIMPGTGSIVNFIKTPAQREPVIVGKPSSFMLDCIQFDYKEQDKDLGKILMVGDRNDTDILFANNSGVESLQVLTGVNTLEDIEKYHRDSMLDHVPTFYTHSIKDIHDILVQDV